MTISDNHQHTSLIILRLMISIIIFSHGAHRLLDNGSISFGEWLLSLGIPFGVLIAWFITCFEIIGSIFYAFGKKINYLSIIYILIYLSGLFLVHIQHGWFVVGSGTNGIEYSSLIIISIVAIAYPDFREQLQSYINRKG